MKKLFFILIFFKMIYAYDFDKFIKENEIILVIKKIYIKKGFSRYPFEEYYFSSAGNVLHVGNSNYDNNGYQYKKMIEVTLKKNLEDKITKNIDILKNKNLVNIELKLKNNLKFFNSPYDHEIPELMEFTVGEKTARFEELYVVEFQYKEEDIIFILGNHSEIYEDNDIQEFIKLLNEIMIDIKIKETDQLRKFKEEMIN